MRERAHGFLISSRYERREIGEELKRRRRPSLFRLREYEPNKMGKREKRGGYIICWRTHEDRKGERDGIKLETQRYLLTGCVAAGDFPLLFPFWSLSCCFLCFFRILLLVLCLWFFYSFYYNCFFIECSSFFHDDGTRRRFRS